MMAASELKSNINNVNLSKSKKKLYLYLDNTGAQPEISLDRRGFMKLGHFDKHFHQKVKKKGPAGKNFGVFSLRYS